MPGSVRRGREFEQGKPVIRAAGLGDRGGFRFKRDSWGGLGGGVDAAAFAEVGVVDVLVGEVALLAEEPGRVNRG